MCIFVLKENSFNAVGLRHSKTAGRTVLSKCMPYPITATSSFKNYFTTNHRCMGFETNVQEFPLN